MIEIRAQLFTLLEHLKNKELKPYSLKSALAPAEEYSDLFVMRSDYASSIFLAENIYALLMTSSCSVAHEFEFFNEDGVPIGKNRFYSDKYLPSFELDLPRTSIVPPRQPYISFTHRVYLDQDTENDFYVNGIRPIPLHRGYLRQSKLAGQMGSVVHGNFGGISPQNYKNNAAKQRRHEFEYTPNYLFTIESQYDLVFNNPTDKDLDLTIKSHTQPRSHQLISSLKIAPKGTRSMRISNLEGLVSIESRMPICRPVIFQNPDIDKSCLNIFHS